ncbi:MAG: hypothetical protein GX455_07950 [Phycisphaerae bacterium]|nr:hypothetical protein [Phycisphaerae bacterium]
MSFCLRYIGLVYGMILFFGVQNPVSGQSCSVQSPILTGWVQYDELDEISGLAISRKNPGVIWVHNDKGGRACVYAIRPDGRLLGIYELYDVNDRDYEDIAIGPGPANGVDYLYVGNIGDNDEEYATLDIYRVAEPTVDPNQPPQEYLLTEVDRIKVDFPEGSRDCEALMVDTNGDLYLATKLRQPTEIYRSPYPQSTERKNTLQLVALVDLTWQVPDNENFRGATGGDISASGGKIALRGSWTAYLWQRNEGQTVAEAMAGPACEIPLPPYENQGEAIGFDPTGQEYFTLSEGWGQPIYHFRFSARADLTGDGWVDLEDLAVISSQWLRSQCFACNGADLTGDGSVSLSDVIDWIPDWMTE